MPELGERARVLGPQPIGTAMAVPEPMLDAAALLMALLSEGRHDDLEALAIPRARDELAALGRAATPGAYDRREIVARCHVNAHWYVKMRLGGPGLAPLVFQVRLGRSEDRWMVWEAINLSGGRSAWGR